MAISPQRDHANPQVSGTIALFTGGIDKHYACGLTQSLGASGIAVEMIGNTEMAREGIRNFPGIRILPLYDTSGPSSGRLRKLPAILRVYIRLMHYAARSSAPIFHVLWNYKFSLFDRTLLLLYYKFLGKRLVFTAHNVNAGARDGSDSFLNRLSLRVQYRIVDHIFVHTPKMKNEIIHDFGAREDKITVIPFCTYDVVPQTTVTAAEARQRLGLHRSDRVLLFFGRIVPYKGIDFLVDAFLRIAPRDSRYRLVIAGELMKEAEQQWRDTKQRIERSHVRGQIIQHMGYIADIEIETYFKGADVLVLPYTQIFQSGVLFMSYSFGLPVIATDVGSFRDDVVTHRMGYVCRPKDPEDLAEAIEEYFSSQLFRTLEEQRIRIKKLMQSGHSWEIAAKKTIETYARLLRDKDLQFST